jgi:hypothetical protein
MSETLTSILKTDTVRMFYDDLQANDYYVFVSSVTRPNEERINVSNTIASKNIFLDNVIFGKKILNSDCQFMIKYYPWQEGQSFAQYDDSTDLEGQRFYAVVGPNINDTGDYRVYKCLYNNNGGVVSNAPNFNATTTDQTYRTADKYIWKYMYKLSQAEFEAYNAVGYIPVVDDYIFAPFDVDANNAPANTQPTTTGSPIDQIFVENVEANAGYPKATGKLVAAPGIDGTLTLGSSLEFPLNEISNYYSGMSIVVTSSAGTKIYTCSTYAYEDDPDEGPIGNVQLSVGDNPYSDGIGRGAEYLIVPRIRIDGNGSGAEAYPIIQNGIVTSVLVTNKGEGYHTVEASVVDPLRDFNPDDPNTVDIRATIRPILSPKGGHNTDRLEELKCRHILLYGYITEDDNNQIGSTNTYSHLGIIKEPEWQTANTESSDYNPNIFDNRIKVVTDDYGSLIVNEVITQVNDENETCFAARVHEIDASANTVYLYNYNRIHAPQVGNDIAFDPAVNFQNSSGVTIEINTPVANNVTESPYTQRSGLVYFMEDFTPLDRTNQSREEYKLLLEF